jgi:hypothetical protein
MPQGFHNAGVLLHYNIAKRNELYPADEYLMTNEKEFFVVTASVFLVWSKYWSEASISSIENLIALITVPVPHRRPG